MEPNPILVRVDFGYLNAGSQNGHMGYQIFFSRIETCPFYNLGVIAFQGHWRTIRDAFNSVFPFAGAFEMK
jgi:hypothetical protein